MDVSPNALRKETVQVLNGIVIQIDILQGNAKAQGIDVYRMVDSSGAPVMTPLLLAKAQCLHTLTLLNDQSRRR